jgi:hypothetical protein
VLLSPERGLILNQPAALIVQLCTGSNTRAAIIERLSHLHPDSARAVLTQDLSDFLNELDRRGLLRETGS